MNEGEILKNIDNKLSAVIALLSDYRERGGKKVDKNDIKTEVLLKKAGLSTPEIAKLMNKKVGAVHKTIQRAKE